MMGNVDKNKFAVPLMAIVLTLVFALPACTCSEPTVEEPAPLEEETPVKEEATEEAASGLSFEAAEYVNTDYGFSVKYPEGWKEVSGEGWPEALFYAAAPGQVPVLGVAVQDVDDEAATFADVLTTLSEATGDSGIEIVSETETTLADGTPAAEAVAKWTVEGFPGDTFALGAIKDNRWIIITISTISLLAPYDEVLFAEIAHTLQLVLPPSAYPPKAGTIAVEPARIDTTWLAVTGIPIKFIGSGWPANELVTIELVIPPSVDMPGLDRDRGEDSYAMVFATADADGNFEAVMERVTKANCLLRTYWLPTLMPDPKTINPLPSGRYTIRAVGLHPDTVATTTWYVRLR